MKKYQNKYRIPSARASFWDYGWKAAYFVTICTNNREYWFGEIKYGSHGRPCAFLSEIGKIVQTEWLKTFEMRPDMNLWMGEYVVMPNHFHAIIGIGDNEYNIRDTRWDGDRGDPANRDGDRGDCDGDRTDAMDGNRTDAMHCVSTANPANPIDPTESANKPDNHDTPENKKSKNQFGAQSKNLASIIRGFKIGVTKNARQFNPRFAWQPRYHDHIIRDEKSYQRISKYIINNPEKWNEDTFNPGNR